MNQLDIQIFTQLRKLTDKILFLNKRSVFEFREKKFFPSEVHLMIAVKELRSTNITRLAEAMGVTKGAVSQTISRLEAKEVLYKTKDTGNNNELTLHFTPFGEEALKHYDALHEDMRMAHEAILRSFQDQERAAINTYLKEIVKMYSALD